LRPWRMGLKLPVDLDVWEHRATTLVVAAEAAQLEDLEHRLLATVVWLSPVKAILRLSLDGRSLPEVSKLAGPTVRRCAAMWRPHVHAAWIGWP
jgi:hypothetical protein